MTEPHHALTVDGEDSGGNEVHEIYVRLEAGAREQPPSPVRNKDRDVEAWKDEGRGGSDLGCPITNAPLKTIFSAAVKGGPKERKKDSM
jgi:hypothetical protein